MLGLVVLSLRGTDQSLPDQPESVATRTAAVPQQNTNEQADDPARLAWMTRGDQPLAPVRDLEAAVRGTP